MSVKTVIGPRGIIQTKGSGVEFQVKSTQTVVDLTSDASLTDTGLYTVSGSSALVLTLPAASSVAGGILTVRSLSADAHYVTSSVASSVKDLTSAGSKLTLPAEVGASVSMISDGLQFVVLGASTGSYSIS